MTSDASDHRLLGVVLCGGRSSRMGRDKAALPHPLGGTFLQHAIDRLAAVCDDVIVSGLTSATHERVTVVDPLPNQGPAVGIAAVLHYAHQHGYDGCYVTPVDTPELSGDDLKRLRTRWQQSHKLTLAQSELIQPLIGIYGAELADSMQQLASSDDRSLMRWIKSQDVQTVACSLKSCRNINTPEDLLDG